jgi:hypothetical protein
MLLLGFTTSPPSQTNHLTLRAPCRSGPNSADIIQQSEINIGPLFVPKLKRGIAWSITSFGASRASGASDLLHWVRLVRTGDDPYFRRQRGDGQIRDLTRLICSQAIMLRRDVTIGWSPMDRPTLADELDDAWMRLSPRTLICQLRPEKTDRWAICGAGPPERIPGDCSSGGNQRFLCSILPALALSVRVQCARAFDQNDTDAQTLGLVPEVPPSANDILAEIATDEDVLAASKRYDRDFPHSVYNLAICRAAAQDSAGGMGVPVRFRDRGDVGCPAQQASVRSCVDTDDVVRTACA